MWYDVRTFFAWRCAQDISWFDKKNSYFLSIGLNITCSNEKKFLEVL